MSLSDIEAKAEDLANRLLAAGKSEAMLIGFQIAGLRDLAQIKAVGDQRAQWNASVEYTVRQTSALELAATAQTDAAQAQVAAKPERRCEIQREVIVLGEKPERKIRLQCLLADGHPGLHTDREGTKWDEEVRFVQPPASGVPPCPSTFQRSRDEYYVCILSYEHDGPHHGGGMTWTGPGNGKQEAEPTKPAADRLHELVSYCRTHAEESDDKAGHVQAQSPPWLRHRAVARAYDDAATKLQDILTEGGI